MLQRNNKKTIGLQKTVQIDSQVIVKTVIPEGVKIFL
jgi:hypothetical protein